jgi:hypothetical protein
MTLSHEDANARLLDLVYGEAAPDERAALEAHVATCPRCTAELASLGGTRARVRAALDDDGPVPPRVRANLLAAAREAVAAVPAKAEPAQAAAARKVVPAAEPSFWARLRGKWTLPTFATVGAVAVVVIASKVFLEPQRTMERGVELAKGAPPAAAPSTPAEPPGGFAREKEASEPLAGRASAGARADEADSERAVRDGKRAHASASRAKREAASPNGPPNDGLSGLVGVGGGAALGPGGLGGLGVTGSGRGAGLPSPATAKKRKADGLDDLMEGAPADRAASANQAPRASRSDAPAEAEAKPAAREGYAQPPSGWKGYGRAALGSASTAAKDEKDEKEQDEPAAPKAASQAARAAAPVAAAPPPPAPELAKKKAAAPAKPSSAPARAEEQDHASDDASAQATLARRADELFTAHRWPEAIAAYRELLRRWPDAPLKPRWRDRLAQSQAESAKAAAPAPR